MEPASSFTTQLQRRTIFLLLLLLILPMLGGCYFPDHPRYQSLSLKNMLFRPYQGYSDIPIDDRTHVVFYNNYYTGVWQQHRDVFNVSWLQGAQEYALYRAGEVAKSKGAKYFVILYKDDWNLSEIIHYARKGGIRTAVNISPGAGLMIRTFGAYPSSVGPHDDRVYEVDTLLQALAEKNKGLAANDTQTSFEESSRNTRHNFGRWRSSVSGYYSVPVPGDWKQSWFGEKYFQFESGIRTTRLPNGNFQVFGSFQSFSPTMPISFLRECVFLVNAMGFEVFKLRNWTVEEYRDFLWDKDYYQRVWFRMTAEVALQHHKEPDSLDPVFVVDEIRENVMRKE